jgi:hypothetical protein
MRDLPPNIARPEMDCFSWIAGPVHARPHRSVCFPQPRAALGHRVDWAGGAPWHPEALLSCRPDGSANMQPAVDITCSTCRPGCSPIIEASTAAFDRKRCSSCQTA